MNRREFLKTSACAAVGMGMGGCCCERNCNRMRVPYGTTIGDRLWMWGHHAMSFASMKGAKAGYTLPYDCRIDMADACQSWSI